MRRQATGFTLLEMLVAIALMAMVAGSLYGGLFIGFKAHRSAMNGISPVRSASLTLDLLRQDFDGVLKANGVLIGAFSGSGGTGADSLDFYSSANVPNEREVACDIRRVQLSVETLPGESESVLMRRVTANLMAITNPVVREQVLCRHVKTFRLRFFDGSLWQDVWDSSAQEGMLPLAVEVTLEFAISDDQFGTLKIYSVSRVYTVRCGQATTDTTTSGTGAEESL